MGFTYNHGLVSPVKGGIIAACNVAIGATGAVGAIEQCGAGFIQSVTRLSPGLYRFKINAPVPPKRLTIIPTVASQVVANSGRKAFYDNTTYNTTTGEFDIQVTDLTPAAADPFTGDSLDLLIFLGRYKTV